MRWGIVGCGWVARDYFAPAVREVRGHALTALCDPSTEAAAAIDPALPRVTEIGALSDLCDAVYVATPNHLHAAQCEAAAAAGLGILCEKPMATSAEDCARIVRAVERAGVPYATAYDQRHHPAHVALREAVAAGALGRVSQVLIRYACWVDAGWAPDNWRLDAARAGGGAAIDLAPHGLDLAAHLLGERPVAVQAMLGRRQGVVDEGGLVTAAFPSGAVASISVGYDCPEAFPRRRLEVIGDRAMARAEDTMGQTPGGRATLIDAAGEARDLPFDAARSPFLGQVEAFAQAGPDAAGRDAALTAMLLQALAAATPEERRHAS